MIEACQRHADRLINPLATKFRLFFNIQEAEFSIGLQKAFSGVSIRRMTTVEKGIVSMLCVAHGRVTRERDRVLMAFCSCVDND